MSRAATIADLVVVGLGAMGVATALAAADHGMDVVGLEQDRVGTTRGSSHGDSRIIRRAYPGADHHPLLDRAHDLWARLEDRAGRPFRRPVGALMLQGADNDLPRGPGCRTVDAAEANVLAPSVVMPAGATIVHDPSASIVHADDAVAAMAALATSAGADLREGVSVRGVRSSPEGIVVDTDTAPVTGRRVVVAAGSWTSRLLPGVAPLVPERIVNAYVEAGLSPDALAQMPALTINDERGIHYAMAVPARKGIKIGSDNGMAVDPDAVDRTIDPGETSALRDVLAGLVPSVGALTDAVTCLYTVTPDRRFVLDRHPDDSRVAVAAGFSGHGFKFAPAIGEAAVALVADLSPPTDLTFLALDRPTLRHYPQEPIDAT